MRHYGCGIRLIAGTSSETVCDSPNDSADRESRGHAQDFCRGGRDGRVRQFRGQAVPTGCPAGGGPAATRVACDPCVQLNYKLFARRGSPPHAVPSAHGQWLGRTLPLPRFRTLREGARRAGDLRWVYPRTAAFSIPMNSGSNTGLPCPSCLCDMAERHEAYPPDQVARGCNGHDPGEGSDADGSTEDDPNENM